MGSMCTKKQLLKLIISFCDPTILFLGSDGREVHVYQRVCVYVCVWNKERAKHGGKTTYL